MTLPRGLHENPDSGREVQKPHSSHKSNTVRRSHGGRDKKRYNIKQTSFNIVLDYTWNTLTFWANISLPFTPWSGQAFPLNVVKVKGFTLSQTEGRKEAEGGRWRRKRASVCDYGANSNLLMSVRRAVHLLEISQMACATLFYLQPAGTASSQGTDCSFGTPLMPGTKEELSRGQCQRAEVRAASSLSWQARPLFLTHFVPEHSANIQHTQITCSK